MSRRRTSELVFAALTAIVLVGPVAAQEPAPQKMPVAPTPSTEPARSPELERLVQEATRGVIRHGIAEPIARPAGAVRVATYNIENLFDKDVVGGNGRGTARKPDDHRKAAADAIRRIDADVLALQEIESKETLIAFRDTHLKDLGYTHVSSLDAGDGRGIEQSVLSRFPLSNEQVWIDIDTGVKHPERLGRRANPDSGKPIKLARSPFHVTVTIPAGDGRSAGELSLWVVHHKSGPFYSYQREAETAAVLKLMKEHARPGTDIVVLGDFNARYDEQAVKNYINAGFVSAFADVPATESKFMSHVSGRTIDHILLNSSAAARMKKETRFVLGLPQRREDQDWRTIPAPAGYASDHYPVVADLMFAPAGK
jgi:endonuclease/exonuclease/phosphatase family metal-dependent hydrolase